MGDVARSESDVGRHNNVGATGLTYLILRYMRDGTSRGINSDKLLIEGFTPAQIGNETEALVNGRLLDGSKVTMQDSRHPVYLLKALTLAGRAHLEQLERALMSETADPALTLRAYYSLVLVSATKQAVAWVRSHGLASVLAALVPVAWGFFTRRSALPADVAGLRGALFAYAVLTTIALIIFALRVPVSLYNQKSLSSPTSSAGCTTCRRARIHSIITS